MTGPSRRRSECVPPCAQLRQWSRPEQDSRLDHPPRRRKRMRRRPTRVPKPRRGLKLELRLAGILFHGGAPPESARVGSAGSARGNGKGAEPVGLKSRVEESELLSRPQPLNEQRLKPIFASEVRTAVRRTSCRATARVTRRLRQKATQRRFVVRELLKGGQRRFARGFSADPTYDEPSHGRCIFYRGGCRRILRRVHYRPVRFGCATSKDDGVDDCSFSVTGCSGQGGPSTRGAHRSPGWNGRRSSCRRTAGPPSSCDPDRARTNTGG